MNKISPVSIQIFNSSAKNTQGTPKSAEKSTFEGNSQGNEELQNYYVQNAGNVLINPNLNPENKIFTTAELTRIKNLTGTTAEKVEILKAMYLEKRGYDKNLINIEIKDKKYSRHEEGGSFNPISGKVILYIDPEEEYSTEELVRIIYHELRHFEQYARVCKLEGLENVIKEHDGPILKFEQELKDIIQNFEKKIEEMGDNPDYKEIKLRYQEMVSTCKTKLQDIPSCLINKAFWEAAISQTKADKNFNDNLTLTKWIKPEKIERVKEYDDGKRYEDVEYFTHPFEIDAYEFEAEVQKELGVPDESIKELLKINAELKVKLKKLYDKKVSQGQSAN